jgi:LPXTG-motif cell wall-anchored protein
MRRLRVAAIVAVLAIATPTTAWAAPTTQVIQGEVLRLVSVADWAAAGDLLPGVPVQWDVEISADAPDPGVVRIGVSATGSARLHLDIAMCARPWSDAGCPGGATDLRTAWSIPRDGVEVPLVEIADTETAYLRLAIALDPADGSGSTDVRVQAHGAGETAVVGPDGGLATTGPSLGAVWAVGGGLLLALGGVALVLRRRRSESTETSGS